MYLNVFKVDVYVKYLKEHFKINSDSMSALIDESGNVCLSFNQTIIQIIDVAKFMESLDSPMIAGKTDDANEIPVKNDLQSIIEMDQEIVATELQKTNEVSKSKTCRKKIIRKRKKKKTSAKIYRPQPRPAKPKKSVTSVLCDICGKSYNDKYYLKDHRRRHADSKRFKCSLCNRRYNVEKDLRNHIKSHLKERAFSCAICEKRFTRSSLLNYHMRIHTGERPYTCDICHLTFTRPFGLSQHKYRMHSSNKGKNIKCTEKSCDKMFVTLTERDSHVASNHKWTFPFKCSPCQQSYRSRISLNNHIRDNHSEKALACPSSDCDMEFDNNWRLTCHLKSCHKDFMYKCPHCPLEFKMKNELNKHMKASNSHKKTNK